jgi:hypothetical protein
MRLVVTQRAGRSGPSALPMPLTSCLPSLAGLLALWREASLAKSPGEGLRTLLKCRPPHIGTPEGLALCLPAYLLALCSAHPSLEHSRQGDRYSPAASADRSLLHAADGTAPKQPPLAARSHEQGGEASAQRADGKRGHKPEDGRDARDTGHARPSSRERSSK